MDLTNLIKQISRVEHFKHLPVAELKAIILAGSIKHIKQGETLFTAGEPSDGLFVLLSGQVQLCKISVQGQLSIISIINPVIMFNEVSALDEGANPVTAIASLNSTLWQVQAYRLQEIILQYPHLGLGLLKILATRNRKLVALFDDLSFRSVLSRTAKLLLEISTFGENTISRKHHSNQQMAAQIATVPEAFSRSLQTLRKRNCIYCDTQQIKVINKAELIKIADLEMKLDN